MELFTGAYISYTVEKNKLLVYFERINQKFLGKKITCKLNYGVLVKEDDPKHDFQEIANQSGVIEGETMQMVFHDVSLLEQTYKGKDIDIMYFLDIKIDDKLIFKDTQGFFFLDRELDFSYKSLSSSNPVRGGLLDAIDYKKLLSQSSFFIRMCIVTIFIFYLGFLGVIFTSMFDGLLGSIVINIHDTITGGVKYIVAVIGFLVSVGASLLFLLTSSNPLSIGLKYRELENFLREKSLQGLVTGKVFTDMKNVDISISVLNYEVGRYYVTSYHTDDNGNRSKRRKLESFDYNVSCYNLFKKSFEILNAGESLEYYIKGVIDEKDFYSSILPNIYYGKYGDRYGIKTKIEISIISPEYKDINRKYILSINPRLFVSGVNK